MANIGNGRVLRVCDLCGGVDDHPRHVIAGTVEDAFERPGDDIVNLVLDNAPADDRARLLRELTDTSSSDRHLDCCAAEGCPTGTCGQLAAGASGKTGKAMLNHLTSADVPQRPDVVKGE
jgi:hypothetical protein